MREIRFRAYVIDMNKVLEVTEIDFENRSMVASDEDGVSHAASDYNFHLMQYTGLKDIYGVDIYEGDIVGSGYANKRLKVVTIGEQEYEEDSGIMTVYYGCNLIIASGYPEASKNDYEIVGNIYENPELLEVSE